jgi:DNA-damage-inducible protein J
MAALFFKNVLHKSTIYVTVGDNMAKTNNLHIRIDSDLKQNAEGTLKQLGMSAAEAITIFLNQVVLDGGIPFMIKLPKPTKNSHAYKRDIRKQPYCYGVEIPDMSYDCRQGFEWLCERLQPTFKVKAIAWFDQAKALAKASEGDSWQEEYFCLRKPDWESFEQLVEDAGFHLITCYPGGTEHQGTVECGPVPPSVIGDYIYSDRNYTKRTLKKRNPRFYHSLFERLETVFASLEEEDVKIYEIFDEETEEMLAHMYDPNDPNFMTADDY